MASVRLAVTSHPAWMCINSAAAHAQKTCKTHTCLLGITEASFALPATPHLHCTSFQCLCSFFSQTRTGCTKQIFWGPQQPRTHTSPPTPRAPHPLGRGRVLLPHPSQAALGQSLCLNAAERLDALNRYGAKMENTCLKQMHFYYAGGVGSGYMEFTPRGTAIRPAASQTISLTSMCEPGVLIPLHKKYLYCANIPGQMQWSAEYTRQPHLHSLPWLPETAWTVQLQRRISTT